jgi:hypothetical protein
LKKTTAVKAGDRISKSDHLDEERTCRAGHTT